MDELERRLRADAADLKIDVSETLSKRIDAALAAAVRPEAASERKPRAFWWASMLTGAAVAMAAIVLLNMRSDRVVAPPPGAQAVTRTVPEAVDQTQNPFALDTRSAVLTEPLEEELEHLKADFERAREEVTDDLRGSF